MAICFYAAALIREKTWQHGGNDVSIREEPGGHMIIKMCVSYHRAVDWDVKVIRDERFKGEKLCFFFILLIIRVRTGRPHPFSYNIHSVSDVGSLEPETHSVVCAFISK